MKGKTSFVFAIIIVICVLSGCRMIALPGQEPFGEQTYSDDQAQSVYEDICVKLEQVEFSNWGGYSIELEETSVCHAIYRTEEYTAAWHEGAQDYLWTQQDDRTWSQSMIASIDFDSILDRAEYQEDLSFPVPPER